MEATGLSVGKSVLNGALHYATSALAEEVALQLGVRRDHLFITNELEMMQAFLESAHDERDDNKVVKVWVKHVRDVAYDVEDTLQEFAVRLKKQSWWRIRRTLLDRRRVANQMKELRANVEDVSQRNMRYNLIKGSGSKATMVAEQSNITSAALFGIDEARRATKQDKSKVDLVQLINEEENDLRVIAVWGTNTDLGQTSIVRAVYENPDIKGKFTCRAWVRLMHPFNPRDFIQSLVEQFHKGSGAKALLGTEKTVQELAETFDEFVSGRRYLIVINDLNTIELWDRVKSCFPNNNMGSRIIVLITQVEVASLCAGHESTVSELKQLSDQNIYAFHQKVSQNAADLTKPDSSSSRVATSPENNSIVPTGEILEVHSKDAEVKNADKNLTRIRTMVATLEESHVVGREKEKYEIISLVQATDQFQVISVWGMGGLGKTTVVKDIYHNKLSGMFEKRACVTVMRPFNLAQFIRSLVMQLHKESSEKKVVMSMIDGIKKAFLLMPLVELIEELSRLLEGKRCLIVIDDVSSTAEWDMIISIFHQMERTSKIIVTTREENIAKHCSKEKEYIYKLKGLEYKDARDLFGKKVFKQAIDLDKQYPELVDHANLIIKKCNGLPLAIVTVGGFLASQEKNVTEWRKWNDCISAELEMNPELGSIRTVLMRSYDGLPYHLKSCFLYTPIFPEDYRVGRGRLVRRWVAEGYSREVRGKSMEEIADGYFMELLSRSIMLPSQRSIHSTKRVDSCQVHDLMREIGISKSTEENLVFTLEEGCSSNSQVAMRHLAINGNWKGDQSEFKSIVDMSRVRSLTVFGEWKSFFISDKMSLLRVLDLEDTVGVYDHHLKHIGKLLHLRYLSLRGWAISYLTDSLGNLRELQTLDVRDTSIFKIPRGIINLQNLNNLFAGRKAEDEDILHNPFEGQKVLRHRACSSLILSIIWCVLMCAPQLFDEDDISRRPISKLICCIVFPVMAMRLDIHGVLLPKGMRKLKALRTLGFVNIARRGNAILKDIKRLTQLRKLGVTGVSKENGQELCSAVVALSRLESLSIRSEGEPGLSCCLDGAFLFPESLQKLKLYGYLVKLPEWIQGLKNLVKLKLRSTMLVDADAGFEVLGNLPNLASLHLLNKLFQDGESPVSLKFPPSMFLSLVVLQLERVGQLNSVAFEQGATPKLELLQFNHIFLNPKVGLFSGLRSLPSLKEFMLRNYKYEEDFVEELRGELAANQNGPILKRF